MSYNAYLTVVGQKQGAIKGSVTDKGKVDSILVRSFTAQVLSPRDPATGQPAGKRQHQPIVIVKEFDRSSPALWNALVTNENLKTWVLRVWLSGVGTAPEKEIYTITLTNASISSISELMADNSIAANSAFPYRQQVSFTYQKIQWTWTNGGPTDGSLTATDDWDAAP